MSCLLFFKQSNAQLSEFDHSTLRELTEDRKEENTEFYRAVSNTTNYISAGMPISLFVIGAIRHDKDLKHTALVAGESFLVSTAITFTLKNTIKRSRPFAVDTLIIKAAPGGDYSFPSGHTSEAFATATSLSLAFPKWYVIAPSYLWAGTVAYSRMYLGVHYPTDILGGAIVGAGSAFLCYKLNKWLVQKKEKRTLPNFSN